MRTLWLPCWSKECTFGYVGEVDENGRPHGLGTWQVIAPLTASDGA
jgi:hypothetical protein